MFLASILCTEMHIMTEIGIISLKYKNMSKKPF